MDGITYLVILGLDQSETLKVRRKGPRGTATQVGEYGLQGHKAGSNTSVLGWAGTAPSATHFSTPLASVSATSWTVALAASSHPSSSKMRSSCNRHEKLEDDSTRKGK